MRRMVTPIPPPRAIFSRKARMRRRVAAALREFAIALFLAVIGWILWPAGAHATTYYLGLAGDDGNPGIGADVPVKSFAHAMALLKPGDQLVVLPGTYTTADTDAFRVTASGTDALPITISGDPKVRPRIAPAMGDGIRIAASNVTVQNFEVTTGHAGDGDGIDILPGSHHVRIVQNYVHDNGGGGITALRADYVTISGNSVRDNGTSSLRQPSGISLFQSVAVDDAPGYHNLIVGNIVRDNVDAVPLDSGPAAGHTTGGHGILIDDLQGDELYDGTTTAPYTQGTLVANNLVYANGGAGILVFRSRAVTVVNNTAWHDLRDARLSGPNFVEIGDVDGVGDRFYNNIAVAADDRGFALADFDGIGNSFDFNLAYGGRDPKEGGTLLASTSGWGQHNLAGRDPDFAGASDAAQSAGAALVAFAPRPGSPAIAGGDRSVAPAVDIIHRPRPYNGGIDLGAQQISQ